jgi:hypothetical protein
MHSSDTGKAGENAENEKIYVEARQSHEGLVCGLQRKFDPG